MAGRVAAAGFGVASGFWAAGSCAYDTGTQNKTATSETTRRRALMIPPSALMLPVGNPDLFNLVKQRFVADLQFARGPLAVPVCALQGLHDQFAFRFF